MQNLKLSNGLHGTIKLKREIEKRIRFMSTRCKTSEEVCLSLVNHQLGPFHRFVGSVGLQFVTQQAEKLKSREMKEG